MPARFPLLLLSSTMLYPVTIGGSAAGAIYFSCIHNMSTSIYASRMYSLRLLSPRMLMLPTFILWVSHVFRLEFSLLFLLCHPLVLFFVCFYPSLGCYNLAPWPLSAGGAGGRWLALVMVIPSPVLGMLWRVHSHLLVLGVESWWDGGYDGSLLLS